jgi:ribonuclease HII
MGLLKSGYSSGLFETGCDEAGRGCLAGPVVAAAVMLPECFDHAQLNDSKKISALVREKLALIIMREAICWGIGEASPEEIDEINILNASFLAMHRAIDACGKLPDLLLIDGNRFNPYKNIPYKCIVSGDATYRSIAAASILAKTHRDALMRSLHNEFPEYGWDQNKGYPTAAHQNAMLIYGFSPHHRRSFRCSIQTKIEF